MPDDSAPPSPEKNLARLLATWEPLPEEDWLPEIEDPPPEPVTCFDDGEEE